MIFTADDYDYIPPELEDEFFDSSDETEDYDEMSHADMPHPKWTWGPNGENSPEYNAWYWDTHKEEIMARRAELQRERENDVPFGAYKKPTYGTKEHAEDLRKALEEHLNKNNASAEDRRNARLAVEREILNIGGANRRRKSNKNVSDRDLGELIEKIKSEKKDSDKDKSKKKSGGGGSSKKSSDKKKKKSGSGGGGGSSKKSGGGSSGGKGSSGKSSGKEKSGKAATEKAEKETKEIKEDKDKVDRMIDTHDSSQTKTLEENFKKISLESHGGKDSPEENYEEFIKALINNGYREVTKEEGLFLWEEYKAFLGINDMEKKENEKLQHGINVFEEALEHHGILGMRWGVQNGPPYPLGDGSHNASEKKAGWEKSLSSASQKALAAERKAAAGARKAYETAKPVAKKAGAGVVKAGKATVRTAKNAADNYKAKKIAKKEAVEEQARAEYQKNRENAIKDGNAKYAREHFRELSNDEVNELLGRLDLSKKVDKANDVKTMADRIDDLMDNVSRAKNWTDKGSSAWNSFAKLYNTMNGDSPLPVIGEDYQRTKREIAKDRYERAQQNLYETILRNPKLATASNLAKLNPQQVQNIKNVQENTEKIVKNDKWVNDILNKSANDRTNYNTSGLSYAELKQLTDALKAENDAKNALQGNFKNSGMSKDDVNQLIEDYLKQKGITP